MKICTLFFLLISLPTSVVAEITAADGFIIEPVAAVESPWGIAVPPASSAFASGLYVSRLSRDDVVFVSAAGDTTVFAVLESGADPGSLEFSDPTGPFGDLLYVSSNNLDGGQPGDCGGIIQAIDPAGNVVDLTEVVGCAGCFASGTGLGEPGGLDFGPGGDFGTDLYVSNSTDAPVDVARVDVAGNISGLVDDGQCSGSLFGSLGPVDVEFAPPGAFAPGLYFADRGNLCDCIRWADATGVVSSPLASFPEFPLSLVFGAAGAFGGDLYVGAQTKVFRVAPDGSFTDFVWGLESFATLEYSSFQEALYVTDRVGGMVYRVRPVVETATPDSQRSASARLRGNEPNPFNPRTTIRFELEGTERVSLRVYDAQGRLVRTLLEGEERPSGAHAVPWDGRDDEGRLVASGVLFARLEARDGWQSRKMVLVR